MQYKCLDNNIAVEKLNVNYIVDYNIVRSNVRYLSV